MSLRSVGNQLLQTAPSSLLAGASTASMSLWICINPGNNVASPNGVEVFGDIGGKLSATLSGTGSLRLRWSSINGNSSGSSSCALTLVPGTSYHLAAIWQGGAQLYYLNGVQVQADTQAGSIGVLGDIGLHPYRLGSDSAGTDVSLGDPTLWVGYALSAQDVLNLRNRTVQPSSIAASSIALRWSLSGPDGVAVKIGDAGLADASPSGLNLSSIVGSAPEYQAAALTYAAPAADFDAFVSQDSLVIRPTDVAGNYIAFSGIQSGNDVQAIGLNGPTSSGTFPLSFGGQTTAGIPFTATPPAMFAEFTNLPVTAGTATELSLAILPNESGFYTHDLFIEVIDSGRVAATTAVDMGAFTAGDFSLTNPSSGGTVQFKVLFPAYVPTGSTIAVRLSSSENSGLFWDVDALGVKPSGGTRVVYDDADATHFSSAGQQSIGGDGRFWQNTYTRFNGSSGRGMSYSIDPSAVQSALQGLSTIGSGNVAVSAADASNHLPLTVEFVGALAATTESAITSTNPVVVFSHTPGGGVPSFTITPQGGSPGSPIHCRRPWITEFGRMKAALYPIAADGLTLHPTDTITVTVPNGWATTSAGALAGATVAASNRVGRDVLPAFSAVHKTLGVGWNVLNDTYYGEGLTFYDLTGRISTFPLLTGHNLAVNANLYPTYITASGSQQLVSQLTPISLNNNPLGPLNTPTGIYTFICTDPGHAWVTPGAMAGSPTGCATVAGYPDTIVGDTKTMYRLFTVDSSRARAPSIVFDWNASGPQTTYAGQAALPVTVTSLKIFPPDLATDPTGMTPFTTPPTGTFHPSFLRKLAGAKSVRTDQAMGAITNPYADFADIRTPSQLGRNATTRYPLIPVASCQQYTGTPLDDPKFLTILVTTSIPHTLFSGAWINLNGCGHATFSDGGSFDIDIHTGLGYGVITVLSPTTFVWHAGESASQATGVTMTNTTTGGYITSAIGTGWTPQDEVNLCNAIGANLHTNLSVVATDACITALADFYAANLNPGLKVRPELGDETWNTIFPTYSWMRVRNFQLFGLTGGGTTESTAHDQNNINTIFQARFAAAGRPNDVIFVMPSMDAIPGRTTDLLNFCAAHGYRVDSVLIAPYAQSMDLNATLSQSQAAALPIGVHEDILDLWIDSDTSGLIAPHRQAIDAIPQFAGTPIDCYEGGFESMLAGLTLDLSSQAQYPNLYRDQHAMHRSPRQYRRMLCYLQHLQDDGARLLTKFYLQAGGAAQTYATYEWFNQPDGTGNPSENPDPEDLGSIVSEEGGAIRYWNSLVGMTGGGTTGGGGTTSPAKRYVPSYPSTPKTSGASRGLRRPLR